MGSTRCSFESGPQPKDVSWLVGERYMLDIVALASVLYLAFGAVVTIRRRRFGTDNSVLSSVSREWLLHYQTNERPAHN